MGPQVGYVLNRKTVCYSPDGSVDFASWGDVVRDESGDLFTFTTEGFECLGSYVGSDEFVGRETEARFERHSRLLDTIRAMRDSQAAYALLRYGANTRATHTTRTTPAHLIESAVERHDAHMRECFEALVGTVVTDGQWSQIQLSVRDGGSGIVSQRRLAHCGYLASWVAVFGMLRRASRLLAPILSDLEHGRTPTHRAVQRAHAYCRAAWSASDEAGDDGSSAGEFPIRLADVAFAPPSGAPPTKGPPRVRATHFGETLTRAGEGAVHGDFS